MCTRASNSGTPVKIVILPLLASFSWKRLQIIMGLLPVTTSSDELFSRINIDDFQRLWTSKIRGFIDFCDLWLQHTLQERTAMKWLEIHWQFANRNCYRLSCIPWALALISCLYCCHKLSRLLYLMDCNFLAFLLFKDIHVLTFSVFISCSSPYKFLVAFGQLVQ